MNYNTNNYQTNRMQNYSNNHSNVASLSAHEVLMTEEVLSGLINEINTCELFRPHVRDQRLGQILDNQMNHLIQGYNNIVEYLHTRGTAPTKTYRTRMFINPQLGLRNPAPSTPNMNLNEMNDQDVASALLGCAKSSAVTATVATTECTDQTLRDLMQNCVNSKLNMAYETFQYMNQQGYYQVPTLQDNTTQTIVDSYQEMPMVQQGTQLGMGTGMQVGL